MSVVQTADALAGGPALVFGSLPPEGRDLDLLVRLPEARALAEGLERAGFIRDGKVFASFNDCSAAVVELVPAGDWGLPEPELEALFAEAAPLDGATHLRQPAPAHALLILARRATLKPKAQAKAEAIFRDHPDALAQARRLAPAWGVAPQLEALAAGSAPRPRRLPRPRRGTLVTLSGLDGAGKSSQAASLRDALDRLGYDAVVEWSSLSQHPPLLHAITGAFRWLLRRRGGGAPSEETGGPGRDLRQRSRLVTFAWSTLVALTNATSQARAANRHLWRGRVVICDRYSLDSKVHLRYAYGEERRFRFQTALIRLLSPRPDAAYLLDVSAETASGRKHDYPLEENARRCRVYREEAEGLGVRRLDGERPREVICAELANEVWALLRRRR
jgi:thymidylate kinase